MKIYLWKNYYIKIEYGSTKLNSETIDKCAVLLNKYSADCSSEF